jgi:putative colanic acid biosysnthesis UDP-glucose lipid carrier transferase
MVFGERVTMQLRDGSDLLTIRIGFRYLIEGLLPIGVAWTLASTIGWFTVTEQTIWPTLIAIVAASLLVRFDLQQLIQMHHYRFAVVVSLFSRAVILALVCTIAFFIDGSVIRQLSAIALFSLGQWCAVSFLTIVLIEIAMLPGLRRPNQKLAIVAVTDSSVAFARRLPNQRFVALEFVSYFEDRSPERIPDHTPFPIMCRIDEVSAYVHNHELHHVLVSLPTQAPYRFGQVLEQLLDTTCSVHYLHDFMLFKPIREGMTSIGKLSVFTIIDSPASGIGSIVKRTFDITASALALTILSPMMLAVAIWIKLDSKGPVFFKQNRWGARAHPFQIYKFRSMTQTASDSNDVVQATKNDMRVTRVGAFIRRTSIDELPQLINILRGEMSLVGPRPHAIPHNEQYRSQVRGYMLRHKIKPGLTGWAQIHGFRGETDTLDKMEGRIEYDLEYLRQWTPALDIYIIWRTVGLVLSRKNAY